jgi:hypothetical protein
VSEAARPYIRYKVGYFVGSPGERIHVTNEDRAKFLRNFMVELHGFIERVLTLLPRAA